ncbi:MAG: ATP-binding protein [Candidatus Gastranaerophilales bacterium]|nr:ATP-binding protein [Candidatus Gastranaerophilales bacterium]
MKPVFVKTKNVKNFVSTLANLQNRAKGVPGMALVYGEPGLGKTQAALWWVANNQEDAIYVSATQSMTTKWLLEEIIRELGDSPFYRTSEIFEQIVRELIKRPKVIIVDEIDYLAHEKSTIEMLRDIHDRTHTPIVLIGMTYADKKLKRYRHLYDRLSEILQFQKFPFEDTKNLINELSEVKFDNSAIEYMQNCDNRFRQIVKIIDKAESFAKSNEISLIGQKDVQFLLK